MKLQTALADGLIEGLETTEEALMNIIFHASSYFVYDEIENEINEIFNDLKVLPNSELFIKIKEDGKISLLPNMMIADYFPEAVKEAENFLKEM